MRLTKPAVIHLLVVLALIQPASAIRAGDNTIPSSDVSRNAHLRQAPELRRELAEQGLRFGAPVFIRVFKESRELELFVEGSNGFELFRNYPICRVSGHLGPKRYRGDYQAPEGYYAVRPKGLNPESDFHLSFDIGYPNVHDRLNGRTGNNIMVHGGCVSQGCFAMTNGFMEQIYTLVEAALLSGQPEVAVHVFPFRLDRENLEQRRYSRWFDFWQDLQPGFAYFQEHGRLPEVGAGPSGYRFRPAP